MNDPTGLIQFGVLGVFAFLMIMGFIWTKPAVDQLKADKLKAEQQRDDLIALYQEEIIPVLTNINQVTIPVLQTLQAAVHDLQTVRDAQTQQRSS